MKARDCSFLSFSPTSSQISKEIKGTTEAWASSKTDLTSHNDLSLGPHFCSPFSLPAQPMTSGSEISCEGFDYKGKKKAKEKNGTLPYLTWLLQPFCICSPLLTTLLGNHASLLAHPDHLGSSSHPLGHPFPLPNL